MALSRELSLQFAGEIDYSSSLTEVQQVFLKNYVLTFGNISQACLLTNIANSTYYLWLKNPTFRYMMETEYAQEIMDNRRLDYVESKLMKRIEAGDTKAILFFLRTKGKDRGWTEKQLDTKRFDDKTKPIWFDDAREINTEGIPEAEIVEPKPIEAPTPLKPVPEKTTTHGQPYSNRRRINLSTKNLAERRKGKDQAGNEQHGIGRNGNTDTGSGIGEPKVDA